MRPEVGEDSDDTAEERLDQWALVSSGSRRPPVRVVEHDDGDDVAARNRDDEVGGRCDDLCRGARVLDLLTEDVHPIAAGQEGCFSLFGRDEPGLSRRCRKSANEMLGEGLRLRHCLVRFGHRSAPGSERCRPAASLRTRSGWTFPASPTDDRHPLRAPDGAGQDPSTAAPGMSSSNGTW